MCCQKHYPVHTPTNRKKKNNTHIMGCDIDIGD